MPNFNTQNIVSRSGITLHYKDECKSCLINTTCSTPCEKTINNYRNAYCSDKCFYGFLYYIVLVMAGLTVSNIYYPVCGLIVYAIQFNIVWYKSMKSFDSMIFHFLNEK